MLTAIFKNANGATLTMSEELDKMTLSVRSNDSALFSTAVPSTVMTLTVVSSSTFFNTLDKTGSVALYEPNAGSRGLVLPFAIIDVTRLKYKGIVEIGCEPLPFERVNDLFGYMKIPSSISWLTLREVFGLTDIQLPESLSQAVAVYAQSKEDIVMGLTYGFPYRCAVTRTPAVDYGMTMSNAGAAIFKDARPESGVTTPFYKIDPDDIIRYNVVPAAPPVTHVLTSAQRPGEAQNYVSYSRSSNVIADVMTDPDDEISAVLMADVSGASSYANNRLVWSDGAVTELTPYSAGGRAYVCGIIPGFFILRTSATQVSLVNRETRAAGTPITVSGIDTIVTGTWTTKYADFSDGRHYYVFRNTAFTSTILLNVAIIGFHISPTGTLSLLSVLYGGIGVTPSAFCGACPVVDGTGEALVAVYSSPAGPTDCIRVVIDETYKNAPRAAQLAQDATYLGPVVDVLASTKDGALYLMHANPTSGPITIELRSDTSSQEFAYLSGFGQGSWCYSRRTRSPDISYTPILATNSNRDMWAIEIPSEAATGVSLLYTGTVSDWFGRNALFSASYCSIEIRHGQVKMEAHPGSSSSVVSLGIISTGIAPFTTVGAGDMRIRTELSKGVSNPIAFPWKAGPVRQLQDGVEPDLGRVEIEIQRFLAVNPTTLAEAECLTSELAVPAIHGYVAFKLDPRETVWSLGRITGYTLTYEGQLVGHISLAIVDDNYA